MCSTKLIHTWYFAMRAAINPFYPYFFQPLSTKKIQIFYPVLHSVIICSFYVPRHSKICYFAVNIFIHKNVSCSQVTVNYLKSKRNAKCSGIFCTSFHWSYFNKTNRLIVTVNSKTDWTYRYISDWRKLLPACVVTRQFKLLSQFYFSHGSVTKCYQAPSWFSNSHIKPMRST